MSRVLVAVALLLASGWPASLKELTLPVAISMKDAIEEIGLYRGYTGGERERT